MRNIIFILLVLFISSCHKEDTYSPKLNTIQYIKQDSINFNPSNFSEILQEKSLSKKSNFIYSEKKKDYHEGKVIYNIPSQMKVRQTYPVILRISSSSVNIYENIKDSLKEVSIPITSSMQVKLIDPSPDDDKAFSIITDNDAIQIVDSNDTYTQWNWDVTPLKSGIKELKLVISTIKDGKLKETVYQGEIKVKINPIKQISFFLSLYWQWVIVTLLLPIIKITYDRYFKKKKE